ncbi:C45 family peptidase [Aurantibacillus circumpalustris]|uniref:C45 family peptidase n=1 Tax=Aurantibacillus circumpalustris TaxID=3036359 RepID=UPI00295B504E|nr:C45 family peptidase [Aurantibacillus circumpalustris]
MNKTLKKPSKLLLKTLLVFLILVVALAIYFIAAIYQPTPEIANREIEMQEVTTISVDFRKLGKNWLRKSESGLWEMYIEGDGFERGVVNGKLTKELAEFQETVFINQLKELVPSDSYLNFLKYFVAYFNRNMAKHISEEYLNEIYGVSLSASDKFDKLAPKYYRILNYHSAHDVGHALQDKNMAVGCTSFGVWKSRTEDGKLLLGRNFDFFAGDDFAKNKIVCFTKPTTGYKFMYVTWAGFTGVVSGMNDQGLTVTINASKSDIPKSAATPISLLAKEILQYAKNIDEAYSIAQKQQTFVSESIMIGSALDKSTAIIEKTPTKINLYSEEGEQLICSNHYRSKAFESNFINNKNIVESSSLYRKFRMEQLLSRTEKFNPKDVAKVLRNQNGLNDRKIGLTNEKGINQLIAHHSIIFKPEERLVWVSASPFQLGKYVCYDLNKFFEEAPKMVESKELQDISRTISADSFLYSKGYKDFLLFKQIKHYIQYCTKSPYDLKINEIHLKAFANSNPNSYFTYWILGDYYAKIKDNENAILYYSEALKKEVATEKEAYSIKERLLLLQKKGN